MLYTCIFPNALKISKTIPLFKKGDASNMSNYRPISLLPTISKLLNTSFITNYMIISIIITY